MAEYGPCLPAHLSRCDSPEEESRPQHDSEGSGTNDDDAYGPALPPGLLNQASEKDTASDSRSIGPALPPHLQNFRESPEQDVPGKRRKKASTSDSGSIGPALPPHLQPSHESSPEDNDEEENKSEEHVSDNEDVIGPLPPQGSWTEEDDSLAVRACFEARAKKMKDNLDPNKPPPDLTREEWMTALPSAKPRGHDMKNRKFKSSSSYSNNDDRSVWTDTPADRERKAKEREKRKDERKEKVIPESVRRRDEELARQVEEYDQLYRPQSLLDAHQKKRKADLEMGSSAKRAIYQPFDHDREMGHIARPLDPDARKRVMDSARKLDTRFAPSKQGRFL